jgi:aspartate racemase
MIRLLFAMSRGGPARRTKRDASRAEYVRIIRDLARRGAGGVILGCTEIPLLVQAGDTEVPLLDTTALHAQAAALHALGEA